MRKTQMDYAQFPLQAYDKLRFGDTDKQGHVNNAVFATFLETGRTELMFIKEKDHNLLDEACMFVLASSQLNLLAEVNWPGTVEIGTGIKTIGNSSIRFYQCLYQNGKCVAEAETVLVQMNMHTRRSSPLLERTKERLNAYKIEEALL